MNSPTWSDLNSDSIVPPLGARRAPDLGPVALMVSCKPDINLVKSQLIQPKMFSFFNNTLMTSDDGNKDISVAGPYMGAPYGAMILESLIARGARKILVLGWCGAVSKDLDVGDLVIADKAIVDEGTSCNYADLSDDLPESLPDKTLTDQLYDFCQQTLKKESRQTSTASHGHGVSKDLACTKIEKTAIWTTDAIYRETPVKVAHFKSLGARAVEMECSALFSVAHFRKVEIAALLVVSDSVAASDWKPGFRKKRFNQAREKACQMIMKFSKSLS